MWCISGRPVDTDFKIGSIYICYIIELKSKGHVVVLLVTEKAVG